MLAESRLEGKPTGGTNQQDEPPRQDVLVLVKRQIEHQDALRQGKDAEDGADEGKEVNPKELSADGDEFRDHDLGHLCSQQKGHPVGQTLLHIVGHEEHAERQPPNSSAHDSSSKGNATRPLNLQSTSRMPGRLQKTEPSLDMTGNASSSDVPIPSAELYG
eukprot:2557863-Prymnesium_polylepis.1